MADALIGTLADHLIQAFKNQSQQVSEFEPELNNLKTQLDFMNAFMADASKHKRKDEMVKTTLNKIRELIYEADDILTDCIIHDDYRKQNSHLKKFSARDRYFRYKTVKKLKKINLEIEKMQRALPSYFQMMMAISRDPEQNRCNSRWTSPVFDESSIIGLRDDKKKIINWILPSNNVLIKIAIVGMGGLGKTTIAKEIFNHKGIIERFQKRIWVSISQTVNEESILKSMLKQLGEDVTALDKGQILQKIHITLLNCNYLLVLDDVWSVADGWWDKIYEGLPKKQTHRNAIIVTTRHKVVAREMGIEESQIHHPKILNEQESWLLFTKFAFLSNEEMKYPELVEVGKDILRKCQGLPLAIKTISCLLRGKNKSNGVWRRICDNFHEELSMRGSDGSAIASLQLSYDDLPIRLKNCLLCCSVFPEDLEVSADWLIRWWIGEGFIENNEIETAYNYLSELVDKCLIEVVHNRYFDGKINEIKLHDLVRDLIIKIAEDEAFCSSRSDPKIHRLVIKEGMDLIHLNNNSRLRSLLVEPNYRWPLKTNIGIARVGSLKVLDLSHGRLGTISTKKLFNWINSLKRLSYLSLDVEDVPSSIGKLKNLEVLIISGLTFSKKMPIEINSLQKLTILDTRGYFSASFPTGVSKLTNLQELSGFNMSSKCRLHELHCLKQLVILRISLTWTSIIEDEELTVLLELNRLKIFSIQGSGCPMREEIVLKLDDLSPPPNLEELHIINYGGRTTPKWINPASLPKLKYLCIQEGQMRSFSSFDQASDLIWELEGLSLRHVSLLDLELGEVLRFMPRIRYLKLEFCSVVKGCFCNQQEVLDEVLDFPVWEEDTTVDYWGLEKDRDVTSGLWRKKTEE